MFNECYSRNVEFKYVRLMLFLEERILEKDIEKEYLCFTYWLSP